MDKGVERLDPTAIHTLLTDFGHTHVCINPALNISTYLAPISPDASVTVAPGVEARFRLRPALWKGAPCALAQPKAVTARAKRAVVGRMVVKGDDDVLRNVSVWGCGV